MKSISNFRAGGNARRGPKCRDERRSLSDSDIERMLKAYVTRVISRSPDRCCFVNQKWIRKRLGVGLPKIVAAYRALVERGELIRIDMPNGKRKNPKPYYFLPDEKTLPVPYIDCCGTQSMVTDEAEAVPVNTRWNIDNLDRWKGLDRLQLIEAYIDAGLCVTPLASVSKVPPKGWTKIRLSDETKHSLLKFFAENPKANVGCWMSEEILCVDVDDVDIFYEITGGEDFETLRVSNSGRGFHLYFRNDKGIDVKHADGRIDFITATNLMVLPPSIHKSGRVYEWIDLLEPIDTPDVLKHYYDSRAASAAATTATAKGSIEERRVSPLVSKTSIVREGSRHDSLFRLGRTLRFRLGKNEVERQLREYNQLCCKPPLSERRMKSLVREVLYGKDRPDWSAKNAARLAESFA